MLCVHGKELRRYYSLRSTPSIDPDLAITIKRAPNREVLRLIQATWKEGDIVQSLYPAGRFTIQTDTNQQGDIFLIGAGSFGTLYPQLGSML